MLDGLGGGGRQTDDLLSFVQAELEYPHRPHDRRRAQAASAGANSSGHDDTSAAARNVRTGDEGCGDASAYAPSAVERATRNDELMVAVIAVASGVLAASAGASPTGSSIVDVVLVTASVAIVTWLAAAAPPIAVGGAALAAGAFSNSIWMAALGVAAFAAAFWIRRSPSGQSQRSQRSARRSSR